MLNINDILQHIPHRYPFLLVDRVLEFDPPHKLVAIKNVSVNEPFFAGHFPENPVMPGVLMLEAMAQAAAVLASAAGAVTQPDALHYLAGIDDARFKRVVVPGDQIILNIEILKSKRDIWKYVGKASVDGELACSATILSAIKQKQEELA